MTQPPPPAAGPQPAGREDVEPTREISLPPGPPPAPDAPTAPAVDAVPVLADQPTEQLAPGKPDPPTLDLDPAAGPGADPAAGPAADPGAGLAAGSAPAARHRSRGPWVLAALVVLIIAVGVTAVLVYG